MKKKRSEKSQTGERLTRNLTSSF